MTPARLRTLATESREVYLTLPRKKAPNGRKVFLLRNRGPRGKILNVTTKEDGSFEVLAVFKSREIIALMDKEERLGLYGSAA